MCRIADHRLIEIPYLYVDFTLCAGNRAEIADMAIATYPDSRTLEQLPALYAIQPPVKVSWVASHIGMNGSRHFLVAIPRKNCVSGVWRRRFAFIFHLYCQRDMFIP